MARGHSKTSQPVREMGGERMPSSGPAKPPRQDTTATLRSSEAVLLCAGMVFYVALFLYAWTLAPTVTLVDSGELIVVARFLGVAHPPGFPLWVMLAHLASLVPFGSVALRINFSSTLFGALAAAMLTLVVAELMVIASYLKVSEPRQRKKVARPGKKTAPDARNMETGDGVTSNRLLVLAPALGSGLLMAFSRTLWGYATVTEVYALNTLIILIIFFLMLRWRRCIIAGGGRTGMNANASRNEPPVTHCDSFLYAAALVFGLALGVHHVTVALTLPALAVIVYRTERLRFFMSKRLVYAAIISIAGLVAVYTYLPLAASRMPIISWGNPRSLEETWWHITGRQYQVFFAFTPSNLAGHVLEFGRMALREFGVPWVPLTLALAIAGFVTVFKRDRTTFWLLSLMVSADLVYALGYDIAEDKDAYYLPAFIAIAIAAGFGFRWVIQSCVAKAWPIKRVSLVAALFTFDWQVASPILYAQEVEQRRRDVKVVDVNLLRRPWYFDYLRHAYPDLIARSREEVDAFEEDLKAWEHDPQIYATDPLLNRRITGSFQEMLQAMVVNESRVGPVYITSDVPFADKRDSELTKWINQSYQLIPQGLVFNLAGDPSFHDSRDVQLLTRGLGDGTLRFEPDDVVNLKVLPVYTSMLINRGRYLALFNQHERAIAAFRQALALNPTLALAQKGLEESTSKLRNP
jgi:hypothetical protein